MADLPRFDGRQACHQVGGALAAVFSDGAGSPADVEAAKALCSGCPFLRGCRDYALDHDVVGLWGGLSFLERWDQRNRAGNTVPISASDELDELVVAWRRTHRRTQSRAEPELELPMAVVAQIDVVRPELLAEAV